MKSTKISNPVVSREMRRFVASSGAKRIKITMLHEAEVKNYVMKIEKAHKKAAQSILVVK